MIEDARKLPAGSCLRATVVIAGTGPAGASIALELAATGTDVLVLEGGALGVDRGARATLEGDEDSQRVEPLDKVRDKRLGGTSHQWGGRTFPFDDVDFDGRPTVNATAWPIERSAMESYYRRAAQRLAVGAYEWDAATAIPEAPRHLLGGPSAIVNDESIWRFGPPVKFGDVLRRELGACPNVRILHHANVTRVVRGESGRVVALEFASEPGRLHSAEADDYVLALGGLETARTLLHSDVGNAHDQVGRNFMTHPIAVVGRLTVRDPDSVTHTAQYVRSHDGVWVRRLLALSAGTRREHGLLNMGVAIWYADPRDPGHADPLLSAFAMARKALTRTGGFKGTGMHRRYAEAGSTAAHVKNIVSGSPELVSFAYRWARDRWLSARTVPAFARLSPSGHYALRFDAEQSADPENRVTLNQEELDAYGVPKICVTNTVSESDRRNYLRSLTLLGRELEASGFATVELPTYDDLASEPMIDSTHQMGVVRMGTSPENSVCDEHLRVWGTDNLYLATSGVFPTGGQAGPTLTIVAFAIRLADHLATKSHALEETE